MPAWIRNNRGFIVFLLCFGLFRTAIADWNPIPSGSMRPTLLEGDVVLVNRLAYDLKLPLTNVVIAHLAEPQRGDIVTFDSPTDGTRLIKRLVGLPGDVIAMRGKQLFINGQAVRYDDLQPVDEPVNGVVQPAVQATEALPGRSHRVQVLSHRMAHDNFGPIEIQAGHYLMLGDNRDLSADSRYFGLVPRDHLIGRAHRLLVSADTLGHWMPRFERFGKALM